MPAYREPKSLQGQCLGYISKLVRETCVQIHRRHIHSEVDRVSETLILQRHLVTNIRPLMDEVCMKIFSKSDPYRLRNVGETILKTFLNPRMRKLRPRHVGNLDSRFWENHIPLIPNLVELDLSSLVYIQPKILETIANNCRKVEVILIPFLCVSERDFCLLEKITTLRVIANRCIHESSLNSSYKLGYNYKQKSTVHLLARLSMLEYIDCRCMGAVLSELRGIQLPSLRYCWEMKPTPHLIKSIAQSCPNIQHLVLGNYLHYNSTCDLAPLTESSLRVSKLALLDFSSSTLTEDFLSSKGAYLRSLELGKFPEIDDEKIRLIGKCCRQLKVFIVYLRSKSGKFGDNTRTGLTKYEVGEPIFEKLIKFNLTADERWGESCVGLILCLAHARRIQEIVFKEGSSADSHDKSGLQTCLSDLIRHNPMCDLESLNVRGRNLELSTELIQYFYDLPKMKTLTLKINHKKTEYAHLHDLIYNIACNNLDIKITY